MNAADPRDARIAELERLLSAALARIEQQEARIAELEAQLLEAPLLRPARYAAEEVGADQPSARRPALP